MKSLKVIVTSIITSLSFLIQAQMVVNYPSVSQADPAEVFINPPENAKPGVLWMWMGSNLSRAGITKDRYKPGATMGQWGSHMDRTQT